MELWDPTSLATRLRLPPGHEDRMREIIAASVRLICSLRPQWYRAMDDYGDSVGKKPINQRIFVGLGPFSLWAMRPEYAGFAPSALWVVFGRILGVSGSRCSPFTPG